MAPVSGGEGSNQWLSLGGSREGKELLLQDLVSGDPAPDQMREPLADAETHLPGTFAGSDLEGLQHPPQPGDLHWLGRREGHEPFIPPKSPIFFIADLHCTRLAELIRIPLSRNDDLSCAFGSCATLYIMNIGFKRSPNGDYNPPQRSVPP